MKKQTHEQNATKDKTSLGYKLQELRHMKNICQKEFAGYLHVSISTISNYENNIHEPDIPTLIKIADFYNVSVDYLLNRTDCLYPLSILEEKITDDYTCSSILNTVVQLSSASKTDLATYLNMLNLREMSMQAPIRSSNRKP